MDSNHIHKFHLKYSSILSSSQSVLTNPESETHLVQLDELLSIAKDFEEFLCTFSENVDKNLIILKVTEQIVSYGVVNEFRGEERDYGEEDFPGIAENAVTCFEALCYVLKKISDLTEAQRRHFSISVLILCGSHSNQFLWSNNKSENACKDFLSVFLSSMGHKNLQDLLCDETYFPTISKSFFKHLQPSLVKDKWTKNPSLCHIFFFILSNLKHPHLADYLNEIFPPPFMFVSHFSTPYQVLGLQCFLHLLENVPPTVIKMDGKEDAIYHTLKPLMYCREKEVVQMFYPCILKMPSVGGAKSTIQFWTKFDEVFDHLITSADMEGNSDVKKIYLSHILTFVNHSPPFKHLKHILLIIRNNITSKTLCTFTCKLYSLQILKSVIKSCWPRMEKHCFDILKNILIFLHDVDACKKEIEEYNELLELCEECLILLKFTCEQTFKSLVENYIDEDSNLPGLKILKNALTADLKIIV